LKKRKRKRKSREEGCGRTKSGNCGPERSGEMVRQRGNKDEDRNKDRLR
jgi:hypothetical protein